MPSYPDKRSRYRHVSPIDMPTPNQHWSNPVQYTSKTEPAKSSDIRPRDAFRVASAPKPPEPEPIPEPVQTFNTVPDESTWEL